MEFFIQKGATLPLLKLQVINDGRIQNQSFMESLEVSTIYFTMIDTNTGIVKIQSGISTLVPIVSTEGSHPQYYICYKFNSVDTKIPGIYKGQFLIKNDEGNLILPIREELFIIIQDR